jgi:uncharacterized protein YtpQ (UPF0354 family)
MDIRTLFEDELRRRGLGFSIDSESGRYVLELDGERFLVSLENLSRDLTRDGDAGRVARFVDAITASSKPYEADVTEESLFWCLETNDYAEKADYCVPLSDRVDRVLVALSADEGLVTWVTPDMLESLGMSASDASERGYANLDRALREATMETTDVDGVALGFFETSLPFKSSLLLAPSLREVVEKDIGWPLVAVAPDRDFLYLWAAKHEDFVQRVGGVVVREYSEASYPISTEVFEVGDQGIRAIGAFPTEA